MSGNTYHTIGSTGTRKTLVRQANGEYADAVSAPPVLEDEVILAAATGSTGGLGKIATIAAAGVLYVRADASEQPYSKVDWRVQCNKVHTVQAYKARSIVNGGTITLSANRVDDEDTFTLNGLTYQAEATAGSAAYATRYWKSNGADESADAAALAALINADYAVATAGTSVAATDKLIITTDEGAHTIVAKATAADYPNGQYLLNAVVATELASIITAINHKDNVTCAAVAAGDKVYVNGLTFTAHATTTTAANREFAMNGTNDQDAAALVVCLNDATYGVPGLTAVAAANVVSFTRDTQADSVALTSSNGTRLAVAAAGGVPGVIAAATGATGELSITPTWTTVLTVTEAGDQLTVTDIDCPGILAEVAAAVITLSPGTPAGTSGELASTIQFGQGTSDANEIAFASTTLASLIIYGDAVSSVAANSTTAGTIYEQWVDGYPYAYLGITNNDGAAAATIVVGASLLTV
jgi:hypothetical protein